MQIRVYLKGAALPELSRVRPAVSCSSSSVAPDLHALPGGKSRRSPCRSLCEPHRASAGIVRGLQQQQGKPRSLQCKTGISGRAKKGVDEPLLVEWYSLHPCPETGITTSAPLQASCVQLCTHCKDRERGEVLDLLQPSKRLATSLWILATGLALPGLSSCAKSHHLICKSLFSWSIFSVGNWSHHSLKSPFHLDPHHSLKSPFYLDPNRSPKSPFHLDPHPSLKSPFHLDPNHFSKSPFHQDPHPSLESPFHQDPHPSLESPFQLEPHNSPESFPSGPPQFSEESFPSGPPQFSEQSFPAGASPFSEESFPSGAPPFSEESFPPGALPAMSQTEVSTCSVPHTQRVFQEAVRKGNTKELQSLLQNMTNCEFNVNSFGPEGQTALHQSVIDGNLELVKLLVKFGADIRLANRDGWSALHIAAYGGHQDIVLYLITKAKYSSSSR